MTLVYFKWICFKVCELYPKFKNECKNIQRQDINWEKIVVPHKTDKGKNFHKSIRKDKFYRQIDKFQEQPHHKEERIAKKKDAYLIRDERNAHSKFNETKLSHLSDLQKWELNHSSYWQRCIDQEPLYIAGGNVN